MKLLLTSGGLMNQSIINGLIDLVVRPFNQLNLAFIPTAANLESGDKWWLIEDLNTCKSLGFKTVDIVDISALPQSVWQPRLESADIIEVGGGNTFHLRHWFKLSGLEKALPKMLLTKVYIGISAGSIIATPNLSLSRQNKSSELLEIGEEVINTGLNLVDFLIKPHLNNPHFPERIFASVEKEVKTIKIPVYALDDHSAIKVVDGKVEVISEGDWQLFNK